MVMPLVLILIFLPIQVALHFHADSIVEAAAAEGLRAAQIGNSPVAAAEQTIAQNHNGLIRGVQISPTLGGSILTVTVSADVSDALPFFTRRVTASASGPPERFIPEPER